jgi:acetylornithine deacetylase/succinyl-diaminopimelate desuccinylase-like protein
MELTSQESVQNQAFDIRRIYELEDAILEFSELELPVKHLFTEGLYSRQLFIPKGTLLTTKLHKSQHQYTVVKGKVDVFTEADGVIAIEAPFLGITQKGTKRVVYAHEDTIWITFHPTDKTTPEEVEADIIEPRDYSLYKKKEVECLS